MDEMLLAGIVAVVSALPGLVFGVALLGGFWKPGSLDGASDPDGLRRSVGRMVLAIGVLVASLGLALMLLPRATVLSALPYLLGAVLVVATGGTLWLLRKQRE